ncbi:MAG TPA: hypothetical protein VFZ53_14445 [Polyangiaceae bacterium]
MNLGLFQKEKIKSDDPRLIGQATSEQFARTHAALQTWSETEHKDDGTHGNVTADSVKVVGPDGIEVAADIRASGDLWARLGTGVECGIGTLPTIPGSGTLLLPGEVVRQGVLIGGPTGYFLERRPLAFSPFVSGQEFALWDLSQSPLVSPVFRIGRMAGIPTLIDGGTGASLSIGDFTEPLENAVSKWLHAVNGLRFSTGTPSITPDVSNSALMTNQHWTPEATAVADLGLAARRWRNLNLTGGVFARGRTQADGVWTTYTPNWGSGSFGPATTQPTLGNGTLVGRKMYMGTTVFFGIQLTLGSTSTPGTGLYYTFTLPESPVNSLICGSALMSDAGVAQYLGQPMHMGSISVGGWMVLPGSQNWLGPTYPVAIGNGDGIILQGYYDAFV